jgi:hypothetical protein
MSTIVTRSGKGSPLTHNEVDANFTNLNTDKVEKTAADITGGTIDNTSIGATTPSTVNATTITGQTGVLRGTGQNLLTNSQDFSSANWIKILTTVSGTLFTAPDGTTTANKNTASSTGTALRQIYQIGKTFLAIPYTFSFYGKAAELSWVKLNAFDGTNRATFFNLTAGTVGTVAAGDTATITFAGNGWYRCVVTRTTSATNNGGLSIELTSGDNVATPNLTSGDGIYIWGAQVEIGSTANTYIPTTTTAVYGTPTLSFSGVSSIGLLSNGALYLQPAGTGALQAQATTSTTAGGNARGTNAVDWSTSRGSASQVASGTGAGILSGVNMTSSGFGSVVGGGGSNQATSSYASIFSGLSNTASAFGSVVVSGVSNTAAGNWNFIGAGWQNSGTANAAVTTQATTTVTSGSTAVTLSGSNASIRVGQLITGTGIPTGSGGTGSTYVAAISGTSLTLSQNASASGSPTLSFFTPHGVVVGGGNNQATGSYSFIGGGGDAGTSAQRNVASGDWSFVGGGRQHTASGVLSTIAGGWNNTASGQNSFVGSGFGNVASGFSSSIVGGNTNIANSAYSLSTGFYATGRSIGGYHAFSANVAPIANANGVSQAGLLVLGVQTTDATPTALRSDTAAAGTTNQVILPNNSAYFFRGEVVSGKTAAGDTKGWTIEGVIKRGANAASTALVGIPTVTSTYADLGAATWDIAVTADTTNGGIRVTFTGQAATTIRTVCRINTVEMTF